MTIEFRDMSFDRPPAALFFVPGLPAPGGSKKAFAHAKTGKIMVMETCKRNPLWRSVVALSARTHYDGPPLAGPLSLEITFVLPRPRGHYGTGKRSGDLRSSAPAYPTGRPDTTKLIRSLEDSLKHILWLDDSQIVEQTARKIYGATPGAMVCVRRIEIS